MSGTGRASARPGDLASWEGPHGIARRPFLALRDDDASPAVAGELARAVDALARHHEGKLTRTDIAALTLSNGTFSVERTAFP